uniref:Uncharacterized protein n=1 Tax=Leersia perrieri TaxID=77586 RepID=A0A0D9VQP7_9ORYZ
MFCRVIHTFLDFGWSLYCRNGSSAKKVSFTASVNSLRRLFFGGTPTLIGTQRSLISPSVNCPENYIIINPSKKEENPLYILGKEI